MGLETSCLCSSAGGKVLVKAHFNSGILQLRGEIRRDISVTSIARMHVRGDDLHLQTSEGDVVLSLGAKIAERWLQKLSRPPPSLSEKLGIGPQRRALLIGEVDEPDVAVTLEGSLTFSVEEAAMSLAYVSCEEDLRAALDRHRALPGKPIWVVHGKGKGLLIGEQHTRDYMRAAGFQDNKVSAVSSARSATRYSAISG